MILRHLPEQYFITEIKAHKAGSNTKISVYLDGDHGIDIGMCATINKKLGRDLDEQELVPEPYALEVSSPGLDKPLRILRQYHKNLGKALKIVLQNQNQLEGTLTAVSEEFITVELKESNGGSKERQIPFLEIVSTHVLVSF